MEALVRTTVEARHKTLKMNQPEIKVSETGMVMVEGELTWRCGGW